MTTEMFGAPVGLIAEAGVEKDLEQTRIQQGELNLRMQQLANQTKQARDEAAAKAPLTAAETRLKTAEAITKETEAAQQQKFMAAMGSGKVNGQAQSLPDQLDKMAQAAMSSGMVAKAGEWADKSAMVRARMAAMAADQMTAKNRELENGKKTIDLLGQFLNGATDQASWDRGNALFAVMTGKSSPYAGKPFSPELVAQLQQQGMSAKDSAELALHKSNQQSLLNTREQGLIFAEQRMDILKKQEELRREREDRLAKTGGKVVSFPLPRELAAAEMLIRENFDNLPDPEVTKHARDVASRAKAMAIANPGLDYETAMHQALGELNLTNPPGLLDKMYGAIKAAGGITPPTVGTVKGGFKFKGGDPADQANWEAVK